MSLVAFVGTYDDQITGKPISGNGKTNAMTGFAYLDFLEGKKIYTNYKTTFSEEMGLQEMINTLKDSQHPDTILCCSEMQRILNSVGSTQQEVMFIDSFVSQLRKLDIDLYYDTQRFLNIHKRLRVHTETVLLPIKYHFDNSECNFNRCKEPHKIYVYSIQPYREKALKIFDATEVGRLYNTNEVIFDKLSIPKKGDAEVFKNEGL